ncbi:MAG: hypothetical protein ACKVQT_38565 [Burkholderiales bacterium]
MANINGFRNGVRIASGVAGVSLLLLAGCATVEEPWRGNLVAESPGVRTCAEDFRALDEAIERTGVRDAEAFRIPGFPYLRVDRFSAHLGSAIEGDDKRFAQWAYRLKTLDRDARRVEISNLPESAVEVLDRGGRTTLISRIARCADTLREQDLASSERMRLLIDRARVPDDYVTWQRVVGLYSLTSIPFGQGIARWQSETLGDFRHSQAGREPAQPLIRYALANAPVVGREQIAAILRRSGENPLRVPEFNADDQALLVRAYAPVFEIETGGEHDRFGRLHWGSAAAPAVDTSAPTVYYRIAYTRDGNRTLTQIVYTIWFPERPHDHSMDLLAGRLDGVVMRVTLSPEGDPLVYDSIHPCGCYHMFFPTPRMQALPAPDSSVEWAFVPATLPAHSVGARLVARIATRTHYLNNVALDNASAARAYTLMPDQDLRTLPASQGTRSVFGPDGIVPGTERSERFLFWPIGIPSPGSMRQWGRHATAFVGRRHFDEADLIEKRFRIVAP